MHTNRLRNWLQKLRQPWRSTGTSRGDFSGSLPTLQEAIRSSATFHTSAYHLPLSNYIDIEVEENLSYLIIKGEPNILELQDAFENIISQVAGIMHNDKTDSMIRISKRIGLLQWEIIYVDYILKYLEELFNLHGRTYPPFCTELRKLTYDYKFDPSNAYQYKRELGFVRSRAKTLIIQRMDLLKEYQRMTGSTGTTTARKKTREDWEVEIAELSGYQGYKIDKDSTMTSEYFAVLARYNKAARAAAKKKEATHGRR